MIVHVSGPPGSGKTTLGEMLAKKAGKGVAVCDTDTFIQHHNAAGKFLLRLEAEGDVEKYRQA